MRRNVMDKISALFLAVFFLCATDRASSQDDRGKQIEAAKKEGKLVWYTSANVTESKPLLDDFEKQYPFIKVEIFRASGDKVLNRIMTETRACRFDVGVIKNKVADSLNVCT